MSISTVPRAAVVSRAPSYGRHAAVTLAAAFALSATHTTYAWASGLSDPRFTVTTPVAWLFYAVGVAGALAARSDRRAVQWVVAAYVGALLVLAVFWYPTTFTVRQQTTFGWFENDVYTALLLLALYLLVQRLRGVVPAHHRQVSGRRSSCDHE